MYKSLEKTDGCLFNDHRPLPIGCVSCRDPGGGSVFLSVIFCWLTGAGEGDYSREQGKTYVIPLSILGGTTN